MQQTTLADEIRIEGIGVHSGAPACVVLHPAKADSGVVFLRTGLRDGDRQDLTVHQDLAAHPAGVLRLPAHPAMVCNTDLCTVIGTKDGYVSTIEHLMAALSALGVDNAEIEIDGPEMPILDGSSRLFVEKIDSVGLKSLGVARMAMQVLKPIRIEEGASVLELLPHAPATAQNPSQAGTFRLEVEIDFESPHIGRQSHAVTLSPQVFRDEIASARTFGFVSDLERLRKAGLGKGACLDNAVALDETGVLNPGGLRFDTEFARHKLLDSIGDLYLCGYPLDAVFRAYRPSHKLNVALIAALLADPSAYALVPAQAASGLVHKAA